MSPLNQIVNLWLTSIPYSLNAALARRADFVQYSSMKA